MSLTLSSSKKTVCKVCVDAGKEENEFTSHFTKNEKGKVICPTLLNLLCKHCLKKGHTVSYCPVFIKNKKRETFLTKDFSFKKDSFLKKDSKKKNNNQFQVFDDSEEDEEADADDESEEKEELEKNILHTSSRPESPLGPPPSFSSPSLKKPTYASILLSKEKVKEKIVSPVSTIPSSSLKKKTLWSEYTSSDDEDYY